jgi:hypothetical protein
MIVRYMITCFGTTFETFTEIESLQGPTTLYGRLGPDSRYIKQKVRKFFRTEGPDSRLHKTKNM